VTIKELQNHWYEIAKENGFEDIEDHSLEFKPLKTWSGISIEHFNQSTHELVNMLDFISYQEPLKPIQSSFPENIQSSGYDLLHSEDFESICIWICRHGNRKINEESVKNIWVMHLEGNSLRSIACRINIDHRLVHRVVKTLEEWSFCE
jgi:hypothetical protein